MRIYIYIYITEKKRKVCGMLWFNITQLTYPVQTCRRTYVGPKLSLKHRRHDFVCVAQC